MEVATNCHQPLVPLQFLFQLAPPLELPHFHLAPLELPHLHLAPLELPHLHLLFVLLLRFGCSGHPPL